MSRFNRMLAWAVLAAALSTGMAAAQPTPPPAPIPAKTGGKAEPSAWDETKAMTRKQWNVAKKKWVVEKVRWRDCNRQATAGKLEAPKSWSFIASCMTKT